MIGKPSAGPIAAFLQGKRVDAMGVDRQLCMSID
jgi:hypothetical protein